ncbi:ABC transporter ATP-binding protein [Aneurinibacillus aneurinilyticus]|uniref:ABC transporter, ATP-binding protein n=1 Tax=Aneurinibacillus aneurinilyticus ATCC 12856 TaxID=649747 RepID=U1X9Z1_ANEAE|nr:ABC transporter ATP-binding protein [Aneurinibacillus aneurinilyticus]ERI11760.1 ABC transporter, ATP-binding protein [Aneurinibacillus aneurinilyticus ATCC 12856]MED0705662.1 ABC transporter ATP-binding protein [Aneurinibacillus aneurinilyticus]MED0724234.1 ABC transporter ATP-binding protein [Aneurinibacillus aneurinilyticus]MED0734745.1 ABC transporter ATP-binding protein [Aneurinibacillus aneurinilyticus]MED0743984.1 ABC transporter ATP-binding protein [Aneurinibacillus aneurinilyticus]
MIELHNISKSYTNKNNIETKVLSEINLKINKGDFISIMGTSGVGKSTLLNIIGLLDSPNSGYICIDGEKMDISRLSTDKYSKIRNRYIGFIFQDFKLIRDMNVLQNVEVPLAYAGYNKKLRKERVKEVLQQVGLVEKEDAYPDQLSGGQKQRVAIARAIANKPKILIGDEPTGNLDAETTEEILRLINSLNKLGVTIVLVTHDLNVAKNANRILELHSGRLAEYSID